MNEQLKDFLKKASEDESIKDELKALEGLSAEENAEQRLQSHGSRLRLVGRGLRPSSAELDEDELAPSPEAKLLLSVHRFGLG